jgi:hypothetical protein
VSVHHQPSQDNGATEIDQMLQAMLAAVSS